MVAPRTVARAYRSTIVGPASPISGGIVVSEGNKSGSEKSRSVSSELGTDWKKIELREDMTR